MSNSSDPDQTQLFVRPDLGPNCLQMVSTGDKNRRYQDTFIANRAHETSREHSKLSHMKCACTFVIRCQCTIAATRFGIHLLESALMTLTKVNRKSDQRQTLPW